MGLGGFCCYSTPVRAVLCPLYFPKVVRVLVGFWHAVRMTFYLDDSLCSARDFARCQVASTFVKSSLLSSGFLPNESKSIWKPTPCLVWLGFRIDLPSRNISNPPERISSAEHVIHSIRAQYPFSTARKLACCVRKIISTGFVFTSILIFCIAPLRIAKFPCRLPP